MNRESLGMVEVRGLVVAIEIADAMVKAANVRLGELTKTKGNGWIVVKVFGDVGAVNAAVDCGKHLAAQENSLISSKVIPRPIENIFFEPEKPEEKKEPKVEEAKAEEPKTEEAKVEEPKAEEVKPEESKPNDFEAAADKKPSESAKPEPKQTETKKEVTAEKSKTEAKKQPEKKPSGKKPTKKKSK